MPHYEYNKGNTARKLIDDETGEILAEEELSTSYAPAIRAMADAMKVAMPLWKTPWNHDRDAVALTTATYCPEIGKAQQNQEHQANINTIVEQFLKTGDLPPVKMPPSFADLEDIDFQTAMDRINEAKRSFDALPAKARAAFQNDPAKFCDYVEYCLDQGDLDPLRELNLAVPKAPEAAAPPEGASPTPPAAKEPPGGSKT